MHAHQRFFTTLAALLLSVAASAALAQEATITPLKPGGVYEVGEKVGWKIQFKGDDAPTQADFVLRKGGLTVMKQGTHRPDRRRRRARNLSR